jgi:spore coat protein CotF
MVSFLGHKAKEATDITDEVIANNMLASASAAANAYLNATIACATPELRAMYGSSLNQVLNNHAALTELAIKQGWEKPYDSPAQQLANAYKKSNGTFQ